MTGTPRIPVGRPGAEALPPVRVLIVDDSAVIRGSLGRVLDAEPDLTVVTTATNGRQALEALRTHAIDVVILDVEMPVMDGLTALPLMLEQQPTLRVLMLSAQGGTGARVTVRALDLGAADFVCKPRARAGEALSAMLDEHAADLKRKIRALGRSAQRRAAATVPLAPSSEPGLPDRVRPMTVVRASTGTVSSGVGSPGVARPTPPLVARLTAPTSHVAVTPAGPAARTAAPAEPRARERTGRDGAGCIPRPMQVLAIASSTGGPVALADLLGALPARLDVPVLITQHMPPEFTRLLAERLATVSRRPCAEARDGETLQAGCIYVAPGDFHLTVERRGGAVRVRLTQDAPVQHCRPAADPMFASIAAAYGPGTLAVVLTGMGHDGRDGAMAIVQDGGRVLAQDEASSVVWGMPGAVAQAGLAAAVLPIPQIAKHVAACCGGAALGAGSMDPIVRAGVGARA